jgi:hypothetical protein
MLDRIMRLSFAAGLLSSLGAGTITLVKPLGDGCIEVNSVCQMTGSLCLYPKVCSEVSGTCNCYPSELRK